MYAQSHVHLAGRSPEKAPSKVREELVFEAYKAAAIVSIAYKAKRLFVPTWINWKHFRTSNRQVYGFVAQKFSDVGIRKEHFLYAMGFYHFGMVKPLVFNSKPDVDKIIDFYRKTNRDIEIGVSNYDSIEQLFRGLRKGSASIVHVKKFFDDNDLPKYGFMANEIVPIMKLGVELFERYEKEIVR